MRDVGLAKYSSNRLYVATMCDSTMSPENTLRNRALAILSRFDTGMHMKSGLGRIFVDVVCGFMPRLFEGILPIHW